MKRNLSLIVTLIIIGTVVYTTHTYKTKKCAAAPIAQPVTTQDIQLVTKKTDLDALVKDSAKPVVVKVYATWCQPCEGMKPHYEAVAAELGDKFVFVEVDADAFEGKESLEIEGLPTVIIYENGAEAHRFSGGYEAAEIKKELAEFA